MSTLKKVRGIDCALFTLNSRRFVRLVVNVAMISLYCRARGVTCLYKLLIV